MREFIVGAWVTIGLIIVVSAIGTDDYMTMQGIVCPLSDTLMGMLIGLLCIAVGVGFAKITE